MMFRIGFFIAAQSILLPPTLVGWGLFQFKGGDGNDYSNTANERSTT